MAVNKLLLASLIIWVLNACNRLSTPLYLSGHTMGTTYHVTLLAISKSKHTELQQQLNQHLKQFNQIFSTYIADSEISLFNQAPADIWVTVSNDLVTVVQQAEQISVLSQGYFDITITPLINLWGFGNSLKLDDSPPTIEAINNAKTLVGYQHLNWRTHPPALKKQIRGLQIDTSSLAKGYAVDKIATWLNQLGFQHYLIEIGGELRAKGHNQALQSWQVAIEKPTIGQQHIQEIISINNMAVASSGNYRNYFEHDNQYYGHSISPFTGYPVSDTWAGVTVLAQNTMLADAWATALMVMPSQLGRKIATEKDLAVLFIDKKPDIKKKWFNFKTKKFLYYSDN